MDAHQLVTTIFKHTETTRLQARASTEIYEQLLYLQDRILLCQRLTETSSSISFNKSKGSPFLDIALPNSKKMKQKNWSSKALSGHLVLDTWSRQQKMVEDQQKTPLILNLLSEFTKLGLNKGSSKKLQSIREEDIIMEEEAIAMTIVAEEEANEVETGV